MDLQLFPDLTEKNSLALQVITTGRDDITVSVAGAHRVVEPWRVAGKLPQGVELATWYDRSASIIDPARPSGTSEHAAKIQRPGVIACLAKHSTRRGYRFELVQ